MGESTMFDRWRRKIRSLFFPEEKEMKKIHTHQKMNVKIKYQYPNHQRFRFPVIPDQEIEVPAYQRRAQENRHHKDYLIDQRNSQQPFKKNVTNHLKEPFKPSQVASPIFGYQPRDSKRDIDKVPAYVRKRENQSDENNFLKEDQSIKSENIFTPQKMNRNNDCSEKDHHDQKIIQEEKSNEGKLKKVQKNVHQKGTKNSVTNKLRHKRQSSSKSKSVPFNVIMTPRDKKLLREKKDRSQ